MANPAHPTTAPLWGATTARDSKSCVKTGMDQAPLRIDRDNSLDDVLAQA